MAAHNANGEILYALVARGTLVFASFTNPIVESGNFPRISAKILENISSQDQKMTYAYDKYVPDQYLVLFLFFFVAMIFFSELNNTCPHSYMFHFEVCDELVIMCMADEAFSKAQCFRFIADVKKELRITITFTIERRTRIPNE